MSRYAAALAGTLLVAPLILALSQPAGALPKKNSSGRCVCGCFVSGNLVSANSYDDKGLGCAVFNGQTCNVEDPGSGIIQSGKTDGCGPDSTATTLRLPSSILSHKGLQPKMTP